MFLQYHILGLRQKCGEKQGKLHYECTRSVGVWGLLSFILPQDTITWCCFLRQPNSFSFSFSKKPFLPQNPIVPLKRTLSTLKMISPSYHPILNENIWTPLYHRKMMFLLSIIQCAEIKNLFFQYGNEEKISLVF